jgi:rhamnogalacturonan endolyase
MRNQTLRAGALGTAALCILAGCGGDSNTAASRSQLEYQSQAQATTLLADIGVASTFGVTSASGVLTVDTGAGLVFKVKANGDISSIKYKGGAELQDQTKGSHIGSGLGSATVVSYTVNGSIAKITLSTATLTHYLLVRQGDNTIYMGTYVTAEPTVGELRWITRLQGKFFTSVPAESDLRDNIGAIESEDIFGMADGTTRSKYYGNQRAMDLTLRGVTGPGIGAFMVYGNRESSSGGPFYRDIQNQSGTDAEVYNYMNSGHAQTEAWRMGFHGPYALVFTDGQAPAIQDMSWMEAQNLLGWVPASQRGKVVGRGLFGFDLAHRYTVGFANAAAQYWTVAKAPNGNFTAPAMKPGTYTMTVYKDELALYTTPVSVSGASTTTLEPITLTTDPDKAAAVWRIGTWDGTPLEFLNGPSINLRHPSDPRNASWGPVSYTVGSPFNTFPAAQWKTGVNSSTTVSFVLAPDQVKSHTVRIGITAAYEGGRPGIKINNWSPTSIPAASSQPNSRSLTTGNYRGNNKMYTYSVPASALVAGTNTLTISVVSGSSGTTFLSPAFAFDALDML